MFRASLLLVGFLAVATFGCSGNSTDGLYPVTGTVDFQGQPLKSGTIEFDAGEQARSGASIVDGKYEIPAANGLPPGKYTVRVTSVVSGAAAPEMPGESAAVERSNKDQIPSSFNTNSQLVHEAGPDKPTEFNVTIP